MEDAKSYLAIVAIVFILTIIIMAIWNPPIKIKSTHPITPELSITVKDGKADTTFIYVEPKIVNNMAYFSNGSEGMVFDDQCAKCKFGQRECPIALVQIMYNYDQLKDESETATKILDALVKDDGTCTMWEMAKADFAIDPDQLNLFEPKK
jgi:hypothetical protein